MLKKVGFFAVVAASGFAASWPEYHGPGHNGVTAEKIEAWGAAPRTVWKVPAEPGFSSLVVSEAGAFTLVTRSIDGVAREACLALDKETGKEKWIAPVGVAKFDGSGDTGADDNKGGDGPRSTPAISGDNVYVLSSRLVLACLDAATGKQIWARDIVKEHSGRLISWLNAASPVIDGDLIFAAGGGPGEALLAFDKTTGKTVWKAEDDKMTHATPTVATIHGERQVVFLTQTGAVGLSARDGKPRWRYAFPFRTSTAASPVVDGDIVYCGAGYGVGSGAARIVKDGDQFKTAELWRKQGNTFANHWSTPVAKDGYIYGMYSFKEFSTGPLKCLELATGKEMWSQAGFGPGNVILSGNALVVLSDKGQIVLAEAQPGAYKELARAQAVSGKCWSTPGVSDGRIYVRSTKEAACLEAGGKKISSR